tara:strand:- start:204 stop:1046 length:843 start_codon:yes stop_codon:yes gene_type:complete
MAVQTTQNLPAPYIEDALKGFLPQMGGLAATDSTAALGLPSLAPESAFTGQARKAGAEQAGLSYDPSTNVLGAGTGVAAYEPYLTKAATYADPANVASFYTPQMDYVKQAMQDENTRAQNVLSSQALGAGAFGGGRHGIQSGIMDSQLAQNIGLAENQMYNQAMQNMFTAGNMQGNLANQTQQLGMGNVAGLGQLGAGQLGYGQAGLDIGAQAAEMKRTEPFNRLGWYGGQLSQLMGGMPNPYMQTQPQGAGPSPFMQALATGAGAYGLGGILGKIWGKS